MTADAADIVTQALHEWLTANGGGMVTGFALCAEVIDADGDRAWVTAHLDGQTPTSTLGLLRWHTLNAEQQCVEIMFAEDDD